ncbi:MAG: nitrogenase component 1 [Syntrophotaleaceae bacterium]
MSANDPDDAGCAIRSNRKTVPGVMSARGCAYAGAKGVVWGPIRDMVHVSHGPIGCGYYSWGTRRNLVDGTMGVDVFSAMQFTSDFQERDIVYGGDKNSRRSATRPRNCSPWPKASRSSPSVRSVSSATTSTPGQAGLQGPGDPGGAL